MKFNTIQGQVNLLNDDIEQNANDTRLYVLKVKSNNEANICADKLN